MTESINILEDERDPTRAWVWRSPAHMAARMRRLRHDVATRASAAFDPEAALVASYDSSPGVFVHTPLDHTDDGEANELLLINRVLRCARRRTFARLDRAHDAWELWRHHRVEGHALTALVPARAHHTAPCPARAARAYLQRVDLLVEAAMHEHDVLDAGELEPRPQVVGWSNPHAFDPQPGEQDP